MKLFSFAGALLTVERIKDYVNVLVEKGKENILRISE